MHITNSYLKQVPNIPKIHNIINSEWFQTIDPNFLLTKSFFKHMHSTNF